jgi:large subunit ribosomal protein L5
MSNLKTEYNNNVIPKLNKEFNYSNVHQIPKIAKIHVSCGLGLNAQNRTYLQKATDEIRIITGQHPILTTAKKIYCRF